MDDPCYLIMVRQDKDESFEKVSSFMILKFITSNVGKVKNIKKTSL